MSRVVWGYGLLGSLVYGAFEIFLDTDNKAVMWLYEAGGLVFSIYVIIATYRCAGNCRSPFLANSARIGAVLSLLLLPVLAYLEWSGALSLAGLGEQ